MLERIREVILSADDMADPQVGIICARCHVIGRHAAAAQKSEILNVGGRFRLRAVDQIAKSDLRADLARYAKTEHERFTGFRPRSLSRCDSSRIPGLNSHWPPPCDFSSPSAEPGVKSR